MSPTPGATVRQIIREAIAWAELKGYRVRIGTYGVHCTSTAKGAFWDRDPREDGIDPLGAVILKYQPPIPHLPDAPAHALGVSIPCVEGIADGLDKRQPTTNWGAKFRDYLGGYEAGSRLRAELLHTWVTAPASPTVH